MIAPLSWQLVPSFLVLADELHFGTAAQRLDVSRQALSKRIARLEHELATPLLERTTRRVELTQAGAELRDRAVPVLDAMDDAVRHVQRASNGRRMSIGISTDLTTDWDAGIDAWLRQRAGLAVMERRAPDEALRLVRAGRLDLALLVGIADDGPHSVLVGHEPTVVVFPDTHPAADQASVRTGDLHDLPVVVSDLGGTDHHRSAVELLHGDADLPYVIAPRIGTIRSGLIHAARLHHGAAIVLARDLESSDITGLAALPIVPPLLLPVTLFGRPDLPGDLLASLGNHLLDLPSP